jgi:hypothetical protein
VRREEEESRTRNGGDGDGDNSRGRVFRIKEMLLTRWAQRDNVQSVNSQL